MFKMQLKSEKGSILLLVMIISVVLSLIVINIYNTIEFSRKGQVDRAQIESYHHFIYSLKSQLEDPLSCHTLLAGRTIPANIGDVVGGLSLPWRFQGQGNPFRAGSSIPNTKFTIQDIQIRRTGNPTEMRNPSSPPPLIQRTVSIVNGATITPYFSVPIRIMIPINGASINLGDDITKPVRAPEAYPPMKREDLMIQLFANVDVNSRIYNCFGFESFASTCQAIGGAYNHLGPADLKCQPDINCITGNPSLVDNPSVCTTQGTAPYNYKAVVISQMTNPLYLCQLCRQDLLR